MSIIENPTHTTKWHKLRPDKPSVLVIKGHHPLTHSDIGSVITRGFHLRAKPALPRLLEQRATIRHIQCLVQPDICIIRPDISNALYSQIYASYNQTYPMPCTARYMHHTTGHIQCLVQPDIWIIRPDISNVL